MKKFMPIIITLFIISAINSTCSKEVSNECLSCEEKITVQKFSNVSGIVKKVAEGQPFYDGRRYYVLVDAEQSLPVLFSQNKNKYEKLFQCSRAVQYSDADTGKSVILSGNLSKCTTGKHGLVTNILITFNIYEP